MVRARGHWLIGFLDQLPAEVVIGLAALRFLSTAPMPKFLHDRRAVLLDRLSVLVKIAFFFACPTIVMLLVWLLVSLNCYVLLIMPEEHLKLPPISRAVGYTLLALQMASYSRTLRIHPGSPSAEWRRAAASGAVDHFVCRRSGRLLPPRGFHIRVINEDILFLDHFCAWINRPIGLRNRKFFLLFLGWSTLLCVFGLVRCAVLLYRLYQYPEASAWMVLPFISFGSAVGGVPVPLTTPPAISVNSTLLTTSITTFRYSFRCATGTLILDLVTLLFLGGFTTSAFSMAARGRVALNPQDATYDVSMRVNLEQIFGAPMGWRWALPLTPLALATDGLTFPRNKQYEESACRETQTDIDL